MKFAAASLALYLLTSVSHAETVFVHAGRLIDPEQGVTRNDQRITIVDGRITEVAAWKAPAANAGRVVDWTGYTVLPGLIDMHTHVSDGYAETNDPAEPLKHSAVETAYKAAETARVMLNSGFTTVRDVGVYRGLTDVALRDAITPARYSDRGWWLPGPTSPCPGAAGR